MDEKHTPDTHSQHSRGAGKDGKSTEEPRWADSLRSLYDSVVDEPIPDSFKDLLSQFDDPEKDGDKGGTKS
jgi:hypothetical protein|tara:strand:- start:219 stop:431 length:213 start_codon:yes stop_codon:yes gene_type:complete